MFKIAVDTSILPSNIFLLNDQNFYDIVFQVTGHQDIVDLLKVQGINNISAFLLTSSIFEVLTWDADETIDLQKRCSIKLQNNTFMVRPGIKANVEFLRELFTKKNEEYLKELKERQQNNRRIFSSVSQSSDFIQSSSPHTADVDAAASKDADIFSTTAESAIQAPTTSGINNIKYSIMNAIRKWNIDNYEFFGNDNFVLSEGLHYELKIQNINEVFIECLYKEKLILVKSKGKFILSNYYRHIKENQRCILWKEFMINNKENFEKEEQKENNNLTSSAETLLTVSPSQPRSPVVSQQSTVQSMITVPIFSNSTSAAIPTSSASIVRKKRSMKHDPTRVDKRIRN